MDDLPLNVSELRGRIRRNRSDSEALHSLGLMLGARAEHRRSFAYLRAAVRSDPASALYRYDFANAAMALGRAGEALTLLDQALAIDPRMAAAWQKRGELCLDYFFP